MSIWVSFTENLSVQQKTDLCVNAIKETGSIFKASKKLGAEWTTIKKYASKHILEDGTNFFDSVKKDKFGYRYNGEDTKVYPHSSMIRIRKRLAKDGMLVCDECGFSKKRDLDNRVPVKLFFLDGNKNNLSIDNIKRLCLNCTFLSGYETSLTCAPYRQNVHYTDKNIRDLGVNPNTIGDEFLSLAPMTGEEM